MFQFQGTWSLVLGVNPPKAPPWQRDWFTAAFGLRSVWFCQCFGQIWGLHTKLLHNNQSKASFLCWCRFVVLATVTSAVEVIMTILQVAIFANTAEFFCYLRELASHSVWDGDSGEEISIRWRCFKKINHLRDFWLVSRNDALSTGFSGLQRYPR